MDNIIETIMISCQCDEQTAEQYLNDEIRNLQDLISLNDFSISDVYVACENLGIETDYAETILEQYLSI